MPMDPVIFQQIRNAQAAPKNLRAKMDMRMGKPGHTQSAGMTDFLSPFHLGIWGAPGYQGQDISAISRAIPMGRTRDLTNNIMPTVKAPGDTDPNLSPYRQSLSLLGPQVGPAPSGPQGSQGGPSEGGGYGGGVV